MKTKKSWNDKLRDDKGLPRIGRITPRMARRWGGGTMVIPAPNEVAALMNRVPKGKLITTHELRRLLAKKHRTTIACPLTTGIFAWIAAHAAAEAAAAGRKRIIPYWRTLKSGGQLNEKYPGGAQASKNRLEAEGHKVIRKGNRFFVVDFEKSLAFPPSDAR